MNRILLGQRLAFGFEGTCIPENFAALVREYKIGNVILFRRNIENNDQLVRLWNEVVDPESIKCDFDVKVLEAKEFNATFRKYQKQHLDAEISKAMEAEIAGMEPEKQEEMREKLEEARAEDRARAEERARKEAEKAAKKQKKQKEEAITPENLEEIQDETLKQALQTAREQAAQED